MVSFLFVQILNREENCRRQFVETAKMRSGLDCRVSSEQISSLATRSPEEKRNAESPYTHIRTTIL